MKKLEIEKYQCLSEMRSPTHRRNSILGREERPRCAWNLPSSVWPEYWQVRKHSLREPEENRRPELHLGLEAEGLTKPCPNKCLCCFKDCLSSQEPRNVFFLCLSPKLLHYGHKWYTHFNLSTGRTLLINHQLSPFPQQSQCLVNPALHRSLQAGLTNKHT